MYQDDGGPPRAPGAACANCTTAQGVFDVLTQALAADVAQFQDAAHFQAWLGDQVKALFHKLQDAP